MPRPSQDALCIRVPLTTGQGALRYSHLPESRQRSLLRQQLHPFGPQHALGCRPFLLQHTVQCFPLPRFLQKSALSNFRLHLLLLIAGVTTASSSSCALAPSEAKSPSAEATSAALVSFIALLREMAPLSRPAARSSKAARPPSSLFVSNPAPPFPASPSG
jgi:hypothetical protein